MKIEDEQKSPVFQVAFILKIWLLKKAYFPMVLYFDLSWLHLLIPSTLLHVTHHSTILTFIYRYMFESIHRKEIKDKSHSPPENCLVIWADKCQESSSRYCTSGHLLVSSMGEIKLFYTSSFSLHFLSMIFLKKFHY